MGEEANHMWKRNNICHQMVRTNAPYGRRGTSYVEDRLYVPTNGEDKCPIWGGEAHHMWKRDYIWHQWGGQMPHMGGRGTSYVEERLYMASNGAANAAYGGRGTSYVDECF
jgi:hypothetical protein